MHNDVVVLNAGYCITLSEDIGPLTIIKAVSYYQLSVPTLDMICILFIHILLVCC